MTGWWTCPQCGDDVPHGTRHDCPLTERLASGTAGPTIAHAIEAYAAYLNTPRGTLEPDEQALFDEDTQKARAAMERAWLDAKPTRGPGG